jgi:hypothetical protein
MAKRASLSFVLKSGYKKYFLGGLSRPPGADGVGASSNGHGSDTVTITIGGRVSLLQQGERGVNFRHLEEYDGSFLLGHIETDNALGLRVSPS